MNKQIDSAELGINLSSKEESEVFKWLLACLLFGKPIQQKVAKRAYDQLIDAGIVSLEALNATSWDALVLLLDQAHYVRYDYSTATKLLAVGREIKSEYGSALGLIAASKDYHELEQRLEAFKGVGPVTASIFLRDVAPIWFPVPVSHDYDTAQLAASILNREGYEAYFIGGAVRDMMLGHIPQDFDLVTNARPEEIMAIPEFHRSKYKDAAQAYGVTRVRLGIDQCREVELEVATFRQDIEAHLGRKATRVEYAELEDDVLRRDFTINALALDPLSGQLIDYVDGLNDLERKLIRFIGDPDERIKEDPLRIIRAVRLRNQLGFEYEQSTRRAIIHAASQGKVEDIAIDRLRDELTRMLIHPSRKHAVVDLDELGILVRVLPELVAGKGIEQPPEFHAEGDVWAHQLLVMENLPAGTSKRLAWSALLHDIGKARTFTRPETERDHIRFNQHYLVGAEMAQQILKRLRFSNQDISDICWIIHNHISIDDIPEMRPSRRHRFLAHPAFADLLELHYIDAQSSLAPGMVQTEPHFEEIERLWHEYSSRPAAERSPSLKRDLGIDGYWLRNKFGLRQGPLMGKVLDALTEAYLDTGSKDHAMYEQQARQIILEDSSD